MESVASSSTLTLSTGEYFPLTTVLHLLAIKYLNQTHPLVTNKPREDYLLVLLNNFLRIVMKRLIRIY